MTLRPVRAAASLAALLGFAAPDARAAELTLDDALARAAERSPDVLRARAARVAVESRRVGAELLLPSNPVITGAAGQLRVQPLTVEGTTYRGGNSVQWAARLEQSVEVGGQRGARIAEVERALEAAAARERQALVEAHAAVRAVYAAAWIAGQRVAAERSRQQLGQQLLESVRIRAQSGAASGVDLALAETEAGRIAAARVAAEVEEAAQLSRLRTLVGLSAAEPVTLVGDLLAGASPPAPPLDQLIATALSRRADVAALRADAAELDAAYARLGREAVPTPTLFVDVAAQSSAGDQQGQIYAGGGVSLPIPVARRNQGERARARAERDRADAERALLERIVGEEVARAFQELTRRHAEVDLYSRTVLPAAEQAARLTTEGYRSGKFDLFRVIAAAREQAEARREHLAALGALWQARVALDRAMGEP